MLWEVLMIGSFWFWLISAGWFCLLVFLIEEERGTVGSFLVFLGIAAVQLFSDFNLVGWMWANPLWVGIGAVGYVVIGGIYGVGKWTLFARDQRERYDEAKEEWLQPVYLKNSATQLRRRATSTGRSDATLSDARKTQLNRWADALDAAAAQGGGVLTDALKPAWTNERADGRRRYDEQETDVMPIEAPHPKNHKARIMRWMGHWPWSAFWTILNDPLRRIGKMMYKRMTVVLVSIGLNAFKDVEDDFVIEEDENDTATGSATTE